MWSSKDSVLIYTPQNQKFTDKLLGFDLDCTLINSKPGDVSPTNWSLRFPHAGTVISIFMEYGWTPVIFSNQKNLSGKRAELFKKRIENVLRGIGVEMHVYIATKDDKYRKPNTGMISLYYDQYKSFINTTPTMHIAYPTIRGWFVGDACGPECEILSYRWANSDREFAKNAGLEYKHPEDVLYVKTE